MSELRWSIFKDKLLLHLYLSNLYNPVRLAYTKRSKHQDVADEIDNVELSGFPPLLSPLKFNSALTAATCVIVIVQTLAVISIQDVNLGLDMSLNCYLIGRLNGYPSDLCKFFSLATCFILTWLLFAYLQGGRLRFDVIPFVLRKCDEKDSCEQLKKMEHGESYMRDVVYMKIVVQGEKGGDSTCYLRRLNRTNECKKKIREFISVAHSLYMSLFSFFVILTLPVVIWGTLNDYLYLKAYPTCSPELEQLAAAGKTSYFTSHLTLTRHRLIASLADMIWSVKISLDIIISLLFPAFVNLIMGYDLKIYWQAIRLKLDALLVDCKVQSMAAEQHSYGQQNSRRRKSNLSYVPLVDGHLAHDLRDVTMGRRYSRISDYEEEEEPDLGVQMIQHQITDFFALLRTYDRSVSLWLSIACLIWLFLFSFTSYVIFYSQDQVYTWLLRSFQISSIVVVVVPATLQMQIPSATKAAYPVICALMANEKVRRSKIVWKKILEYFTDDMGRYGFTLFFSHQVSWMTLFQLAATTVSYVVILATLKLQHSN